MCGGEGGRGEREREKGGKGKRRDGEREGIDEREEVGIEGKKREDMNVVLFMQTTQRTWKSMSCVCS